MRDGLGNVVQGVRSINDLGTQSECQCIVVNLPAASRFLVQANLATGYEDHRDSAKRTDQGETSIVQDFHRYVMDK